MDEECRVDLVVDRRARVGATDELQEKECFCAVFQDLDCALHYHEIRDDTIEVSAYPTDRSEVRYLIRELKELLETIRLVRLTAIGSILVLALAFRLAYG